MKNLCTQCVVILTFACFAFTPPLHAQLPGSGDGAPELSAEASRAIDKGLAYLLTVQKKDGSWDSNGEGGHAVGITSLALMAFMSKAHFPGFGQYGDQLDRGMKWLLKQARERPDGYLGTVMYEHGLATLALSELWGMARDPEDDDAIQKALEKAVDVILRSQNPGGGGATNRRRTAARTPPARRRSSTPWPRPARPESMSPTKRSPKWQNI